MHLGYMRLDRADELILVLAVSSRPQPLQVVLIVTAAHLCGVQTSSGDRSAVGRVARLADTDVRWLVARPWPQQGGAHRRRRSLHQMPSGERLKYRPRPTIVRRSVTCPRE